MFRKSFLLLALILVLTMADKGFPGVSKPNPANGAVVVDTWVNLSWQAGGNAASFDVYLGDNLEDVKNGTGDTSRGNQISTYFVAGFPGFPYPDGLVPGTTYYWRIDEVQADSTVHTGSIWSFSIPSKAATNPDPADGAEFVDTDATLRWEAGFGAKLHTVYIGEDFDAVNNSAGGLPQGMTNYKPAKLDPEKVYYWRVDEFDAKATYKGNVWSFTTLGAAGNPQPSNGAADVSMMAKLTWKPADNAVSHDVYLGTDRDAVRNATTTSPEYKGNKTAGNETLDPGKLGWDTVYYWRVDAIYSTGPVKGLIWTFSTADFLVVDDFESYNDIDPPDPVSNRIFDNWIDGFGTTDNGALVGNDMPPYAERTAVRSGAQSMPYFYDNNLKYSEATLTLTYPKDWTENDVNTLTLYFRGNSANAPEQMYISLNGSAPVYYNNPDALKTPLWTGWNIELTKFANQGVNLASVNTISIGFGDKNNMQAGGSGKVYVDDIRLAIAAAPVGRTLLMEEDFESVVLGPSVEESAGTPDVWTDTPPEGWIVDESGVPGIGNPANDGVTEWAGWAFAEKEFWINTDHQRREEFLLGQGVVAVADGDEWDDAAHPEPISANPYDTWLSSPPIDISGVQAGSVQLKFDSSWRPEYDDDYHQTANITASFDGAEPIEILRWESESTSPNFKNDNSTNETIVVDVDNPPWATTVVLTFGYFDAGNDWWWAIDNIVVSGLPK